MTGERVTRPNPFRGWRNFGLPAFAAALAPWQDKLTQAALAPAYYQPNVSIVASLVATLACFVIWIAARRASHRFQTGLALLGLSAFVLGVFLCLFLTFTVDVVWYPAPMTQVILRFGWAALYIVTFASFGVAMVGGLLLVKSHQKLEPSATKSPRAPRTATRKTYAGAPPLPSLRAEERRRSVGSGHFTRVKVSVWSRAGWPAAAWVVRTRVSPASFMSES